MESSQLFEDSEECSSESGWTTYIASPVHSDDSQDDNYAEDGDEHNNDDDGKDDNDDSDDSMASDASTGPNHGEGEHLYESGGEGGRDTTQFKHDQQEEYSNKCYSYKKVYRHKEKKRDEERGRRDVKQGSVLKANSETSSVHSGVRVRKARWIEKGN